MNWQEFEKLMHQREAHLNAKEEIDYFNIQREYDGLKKIIEGQDPKSISKYKMARLNILHYIIKCAENDPINGNWFDEENFKILKEAGILLYEDDGMRGMHDNLVWSFIPKRYHREIDLAWNNIGEWKS